MLRVQCWLQQAAAMAAEIVASATRAGSESHALKAGRAGGKVCAVPLRQLPLLGNRHCCTFVPAAAVIPTAVAATNSLGATLYQLRLLPVVTVTINASPVSQVSN